MVATLDQVVEAVNRADDDSWAIADLIADLPAGDEHGKLTNARVAAYISEHTPREWSASTVSHYRGTSIAWPPSKRLQGQTFTAHLTMRSTPDKLARWVKAHPNQVLSARDADQLRPKSTPPDADTTRLSTYKRVRKQLDALLHDDPALVLEIEDLCQRVRAAYPKAIAKAERERDGTLRVV